MTPQPSLPDPRDIRQNYQRAQITWCVHHMIGHVVITLFMIATGLVLQGSEVITLPPELVWATSVIPLFYLLVAAWPQRLEDKFQATHPYDDYVEPPTSDR